jgi:hypothetical protein
MTPYQAVKNPITCEDRRRRFVGPWSTLLADAASIEHKSKENSRKRTRVVAICSGFILFAAGFCAGKSGLQTVHAQNPIKVTIPQSWGRCVASVPGGLVFEDSQGVVRMTDMQGNVQAELIENRNRSWHFAKSRSLAALGTTNCDLSTSCEAVPSRFVFG